MLLIRNAKLFTMEGAGYIEGGDVLIDGKKIVTVGSNLSCGEAEVIDALRRAQVDSLSPLEALNLLYELKLKLK